MNADIGQMQEMTAFQSYHTPKILPSLKAGVGLAMASGKNAYTLVLI
jgi:hypothetical protein